MMIFIFCKLDSFFLYCVLIIVVMLWCFNTLITLFLVGVTSDDDGSIDGNWQDFANIDIDDDDNDVNIGKSVGKKGGKGKAKGKGNTPNKTGTVTV